jgi:signal transduction histidine kinase
VGQSLSGLESTLSRLRIIYTVGTALVLIFGLLGGGVLARLGLRPVARITQAARTIAQAEDLSRRVPYTGPGDEIGALAVTFNEMLDRLQRLFEGQRRFLGEAAHELRTPLASMLGNVDLLARFGSDPIRRQETVAALQRTGRHVARLLDDLLLLAQAEAGWHLRELRPVALDDIFVEAYEAAQLLSNGIALRMQLCQPTQVRGDPDRLRQVFSNLIDNALKYSTSDSIVTLQLTHSDCQAQVQICNSSAAIPAGALPRLFEPFFRAPVDQQISGAGLGLSIVDWIVREHGGEVSVQGTPEGGVSVTVTLPMFLN